MKKENFFKRHRILLSIITLIVIVILYTRKPWIDNSPKSKVYYDMETTVQTWTLENSLTLQWTTQFADSQKLTFMTQWKVIAVNVKVWDKVKKWQVLAKISTDDLDNSAEQTRLDIENQKNALQDLLNNRNIDLEYLQEKANHDALILQQETIDQDQELAMQTLLQQIKDAQKLYDETLADYQELLSWNNSANADLALSSTIRKRNQILENWVLELKTIINTVNAALDTYDKKLIITNKYRYEVARNDYIWADDLFSKNKSETLFHQINKNLETLKWLYETLNWKEVSKLIELTKEYNITNNLSEDYLSKQVDIYSNSLSDVLKYADKFEFETMKDVLVSHKMKQKEFSKQLKEIAKDLNDQLCTVAPSIIVQKGTKPWDRIDSIAVMILPFWIGLLFVSLLSAFIAFSRKIKLA